MKKGFIKKFGAIAFALIVFAGCWNLERYDAYVGTVGKYSFDDSLEDIPYEDGMEFAYSYTVCVSGFWYDGDAVTPRYYTLYSDSPMSIYNENCFEYYSASYPLVNAGRYLIAYSESRIYLYDHREETWPYCPDYIVSDGNKTCYGLTYGTGIYFSVDGKEINVPTFDVEPNDGVAMILQPLYYGAFTIGQKSNLEIPAEYNSDLGYLQNITQKLIAVNNASGGVDLESARLKFTFDSLSTSGVDLSSGEYSVRVYQQVCYYKENLSEVFKEDYPLVKIGEFPISDNSVSFTIADAMAKVDSETDGILSSWDMFWNGCERSDSTYLQIIKKGSDGSEEYGGMVKLMYPASGGVFSSTYTPELAPDDGGYIGDNVESGMGTGTNFDDAELNADDDIVNGSNSSDSLIGMVNGYISTLGAIPTMIANMLSFLPQWCVDLISVSFGLLCVLIGFKFLRG